MKRTYSKVAAVHRTLKMTPHGIDPQRGDDVKVLQRAINERRGLTGDAPVKLDGWAGRDTIAKGRRLYVALGGSLYAKNLPVGMQVIIRKPELRNPVQLARAKRYRKEHPVQLPVTIAGNKVTGGTARQREVAAAEESRQGCATGGHRWFYSQAGGWTAAYGITGPPRGKRSDCSQWDISISKSAGSADPSGANFTGGNTDTLASHCVEIARHALEPGDRIIYFRNGRSHHVERYHGDGERSYAELARMKSPVLNRTIGHGTAPVDYGDIDMQSGARFFRSPGLS